MFPVNSVFRLALPGLRRSDLSGVLDGPSRVARRKCRRDTDVGDFDAGMIVSSWLLIAVLAPILLSRNCLFSVAGRELEIEETPR